jgi:hypothetical protein
MEFFFGTRSHGIFIVGQTEHIYTVVYFIFWYIVIIINYEIIEIIFFNWVMLNNSPGALIKHTKEENKKTFNIRKVTFYIFKVLNAHISRQIFFFNMLNHFPF